MRLHAFKLWEKLMFRTVTTIYMWGPMQPTSYEGNVFTSSLEAQRNSSLNYEKETYLTSFSTIPSSEGTPTLIAFVSSGSS